jgi:hypothetical protein
LTEIGFISNPAEEALMKQDAWDELVASAICRGFSRAMGIAYSEDGGGNDMLSIAVLLHTKDDFWAGYDVAYKNNNCAIFVRNPDKTVPGDAWNAQRLAVVGGPTTGHQGEILLSGKDKYDTAAKVKEYLG